MKKIISLLVTIALLSSSITVSADGKFDLRIHEGKVVYVDFWASWCTPCRASFPFMKDMVDRYGNSLVIVAINVDKERRDADEFLQQFDVDFHIVYDPEGALAQSFDVKAMPMSFLYDRQGQLIGSHIGFRQRDMDDLENAISNAINNQN